MAIYFACILKGFQWCKRIFGTLKANMDIFLKYFFFHPAYVFFVPNNYTFFNDKYKFVYIFTISFAI